MKIWKLIAGILSIILFLVVTFQSCAVGALNAINNSESTAGAAGVVVSILMLVGGIVSIVLRNSEQKSGDIAIAVIFGISALIGFLGHGNYSDLIIWSVWCSINTATSLLNLFLIGKKENKR